ncbi:DUF3025 domain-containing protein [Neptunicella sp. SCSIO 80796]|uniref:DUF3025 domain-containing protein n=1 Tax=Neptunicella plasticusilytica TaxID=3117012 RepID=UPI003A4D3FD8
MQWFYHIWQHPPFNQLARFGFEQLEDWPDCEYLNRLSDFSQRFVAQQDLVDESDYYEQIIFRRHIIPTRMQNWHDLFNACIWLNFPLSKAELNRQHMQDINQFGLNPRTPRRNRITHFDECGVLLAYSDEHIPALLRERQWKQAFVDCRQQWGGQVDAVLFGHANYEMLLQPFIGLTGKFLGLRVSEQYWSADWQQKCKILDNALLEQLEHNVLADKNSLSPLPLLGIPDWYEQNQHAEFYQNKNYFMPKPKR